MSRARFLVLVLTGLLSAVVGCSSNATELGEVHGRVTLQGQPLPNLQVTFAPEKSSEKTPSPTSTGITDSGGNYRVTSGTGIRGAAIGWHRVVIDDVGVNTTVANNSREAQDEKPLSMPAPSRVPQRYSTAAETPLRHEVKPGDNMINLELTP